MKSIDQSASSPTRRQASGKRLFDLALAVPVFLLALPFIAALALLVRWRLGAPAIFSQRRPGLHGRPFRLYKLRTMTDERDERGELLPDSRRLTPLGRLLRESSLDELPQLWNVIRGDLSLVGPRPLLMDYIALYTPEQAKRHLVKPGVTGWAQVNGRNAISWEEKLALDVWYVEHRRFRLDCKILLLTLRKVVKREGIRQEGQATVSRFQGSEDRSVPL